jgi:hypothetical protein
MLVARASPSHGDRIIMHARAWIDAENATSSWTLWARWLNGRNGRSASAPVAKRIFCQSDASLKVNSRQSV